jgi:predicted DNA-binding transcriptional regulator AlpA
MSTANSDALDPEGLIDGPSIDADLGITDRCRRQMISDGRLPPPIGYIGGRARWRRADYLAARERLLAAGRPRRPGLGAPIAA